MTYRVGFVGMTHLGLCSATACIARGFEVIGFDTDQNRINELNKLQTNINEPNLYEWLEKSRSLITFTADPKALNTCDIVYISYDVPTNDKGDSDLTVLEDLISAVSQHLNDDAILVVLSQVNPGFTRKIDHPRDKCFYQVETLVFGNAIERAMYPERYIIGRANDKIPLPKAFESYLKSYDCPILLMGYESAELAKIAINACLVASVSVANTLAELSENIGANWREIVPALQLDKRIGPHSYLMPGLGLSGGNLERDLATINKLASLYGSDDRLVKAWIENSKHRKSWLWKVVYSHVLPYISNPQFAVLGLSYKPNTHSVKNSPSIEFLRKIKGFSVKAYDPCVKASKEFHPNIQQAQDPLDTCENADVLIVATAWDEFKLIDPSALSKKMKGKFIIDPYGILPLEKGHRAGLKYITLGQPYYI